MIIQMKSGIKNKEATQLLERQFQIKSIYDFSTKWGTLKNSTEKYCFIIDLDDESGLTSDKFLPEILALRLHDYQLPSSVTDIYLLISQVSHFQLALFAHRLSQILEQKYQRKIAIHIIASLNYDISLLTCLPEENKWQIHGASFSNFDPLDTTKNLKLIWEGDNIQEYMNSSQQTFNGKAYAWDIS